MLNEGDTQPLWHYFKMCYNRFMDIKEQKRRCCKAPPDTKLVIWLISATLIITYIIWVVQVNKAWSLYYFCVQIWRKVFTMKLKTKALSKAENYLGRRKANCNTLNHKCWAQWTISIQIPSQGITYLHVWWRWRYLVVKPW